MEGLETRELAYFVAVAEELHFGRAAQRLGIAQPPLSRAIQQLERRLGVRLLERDSHHVALTPAGQVLLRESRCVLDAVAAAVARTRRAGHNGPRLILAMKPGGDAGLLPDILTAYAREAGSIPVDVRTCRLGEQPGLLRRAEADVAILYGHHLDLDGLDCERLLVEPQVVVLPRQHRLADRTVVRVAELRGENMPDWTTAAPDGTADAGTVDPAQLMQLIALGRAVAIIPESASSQVRRDLVCVPVLDAPPTSIAIAWAARSRSRTLATFVRTATAVAAGREAAQAAR